MSTQSLVQSDIENKELDESNNPSPVFLDKLITSIDKLDPFPEDMLIMKPKITRLTYDGSYLGEHNFDDVISNYLPCTEKTRGNRPIVLYAQLTIEGHTYPIILKRNCSKKPDQVIVDQLKPFFGLKKMGTHRIRLKGVPRKIIDGPWLFPENRMNVKIISQWSDYYVFKGQLHSDTPEKVIHMKMKPITYYNWLPTTKDGATDDHRHIYLEIQKILVFRQLTRVQETNLDDILVNVTSGINLVSIDEMIIRSPDETSSQSAIKRSKLTNEVERFFFPKTTSQAETCIRMFQFTPDTYMDKIQTLRNSISEVIRRIDQEYLWLVNQIISELTGLVSVYYDLQDN